MEGMIEVTNVDLVKLAKEAYDLSVPQGLGYLHFTPDPLSDDEAKALVREDRRLPLSLDYVNGRACKLTVTRAEDGKLYIRDSWYDHSKEALQELRKRCGF